MLRIDFFGSKIHIVDELSKPILKSLCQFYRNIYFLVCNKKTRFDFADELKIGDVRYKHLTQITIKVQLFLTFSI